MGYKMTSAINPTLPQTGVAFTADLRTNLLAAKNEIEALQLQTGRGTAFYIYASYFGVSSSNPNNRAALQACIDYVSALVGTGNNNGAVVLLPAGLLWFTGTINITNSFISIRGPGKQSCYLAFANGSNDCIVINGATAPGGNLRDVTLSGFGLIGSGKTGGASIKVLNVYRVLMDDISLDNCIVGVDVGNNTNWVKIRDTVIIPNEASSLYGIYWHCPGDGSARSDVLIIDNVVVECQWSNADCFVWDGACYTLVGSGLRLLHGRYGMRILNTANSGSYFPSFANLHDVEMEGFKNRALDIRGGNDIKFTTFDINNLTAAASQGDADDYSIYIDADSTHSITRGVQLVNGRVGLCRSNAVYSDSRDLQISNVIAATSSYAGVGSAAVIRLGANSLNVQISNFVAEEFGGTARASYAIQIDAGADRVCGCNIDATRCNTEAILNNSTGAVGFANVIHPGGAHHAYLGGVTAIESTGAAGISVGASHASGTFSGVAYGATRWTVTDVKYDLANGTSYYVNNQQVVTNRKTGWAAATGTATRTTFDTTTVTTANLAQRVKALLDDLIAHGLIGA